jgi:hypothetical protein
MADPRKATHKFRHKTYFKLLKPQTAAEAAAAAAAGTGPWNVPDLCKAYNWPANLAGGGVIAIVELGGGWVQSDISAFFQPIGQSAAPQITDVSVDATKNNPNQSVGAADDPDIEVALDIEVAGAAYFAATGKAATIRVYWSQSIDTAVQKAAEDGCAVCSISWGADEALWGTSAVEAMESVAEAATSMGMVVFGATGDNDSSDGGPTPANVMRPLRVRMWWPAVERTRLQPRRRFGTTTPAPRMVTGRAEATRPSSRCRRFRSARHLRRQTRSPAVAGWFPMSVPMRTPTVATTFLFTERRR